MSKIKNVLFLHAIIFLYSLSSLCSKFASELEFFSFKWILLYALLIFILGIYAILWQQLLKKLPLNFAYANKSLTLIWGMLFGIIIFKEKVTVMNIIGALVVLAGVILMVTDGRQEKIEEFLSSDDIVSEGKND